jgi:hypothetical protein
MHDIDLRFLEAGHAIFTVGNDKGDHYTYRIVKPSKDKPFFVSLLTGPDNCGDYTYLGIFNPLTREVYRTAKSKYLESSTPVKVIRWAIKVVANNTTLPPGYSIHHEGRCCRCGRRLTTPESVEAGIGPECARMAGV